MENRHKTYFAQNVFFLFLYNIIKLHIFPLIFYAFLSQGVIIKYASKKKYSFNMPWRPVRSYL
jgi:hypothetical protein